MDDKQQEASPHFSHPASRPAKHSNVDTDQLEKPRAEASDYLEHGLTTRTTEYQKREAKLVKKLDIFIAPVMMMLMLISYLDRGNIGFAATQGMADDIGLVSNQLNVCRPSYRAMYEP